MLDSFELLEWPVLFEHLLAECLTPYGVHAWQTAPFLDNVEAMQRHQAEVDGLKTLLIRYGDVTSETSLPEVRPVIRRLEKEGYLNLNELRNLMRVLSLGGRLLRHFSRALKSEPQLDMLDEILDDSVIPDDVLDHLNNYIEADGSIKDSASPLLLSLRHKLRHQRQALTQKIQHYLHDPEYSSALQSTTVTEREGRTVLPVKVEYKSKLPGVIHGASSTGSTIYVEPHALVEINNAMQGVQADLHKEIERILKELSIYLHPHWEALQALTEALGRLDRRLAAARFSRVLNANPVEIIEETQAIAIKQARHPLLVLNTRKKNPTASLSSVVANDMTVGDGVRTLVITGPNTGGKTVLLKMIGLFACMLKAGLHLPVGEQSRMSCFDPILVDIGDQQNLAQSLSTFSAHLERLKHFVSDETDLSKGLVLIDEIAAGTDPAEGAALAKAVLDELYQKGALTLVTTHLGELKLDAHQHDGFMNASVEFDAETLSPTYRLMIGVPGASNAITIAQKLGLKQGVIDKAKAALSAPVREAADLLQELETRNRQLADELRSARSFRVEAQEAYEKVEYQRQKLEEEKRQALKQFQTGLKGRIHDLENQIKILRKEIQQGEKPDLDQISGKLKGMGRRADQVFGDARDSINPASRLTVADLKVGETVTSRQLEITGEIVSINASTQEVSLQAGILKVTVPVSDLQKPYKSRLKGQQPAKAKQLDRPRRATEGASVVDEPLDPSLSCDVRGQRTEDAMLAVEKFLDDAMMNGYQAVGIVHGMGTGILKKEIRYYLSNSGYVKRFYPAQATQGGDGKTIVELKG